MELSYVIPCYNEDPEVLRETVRRVAELGRHPKLVASEILVVNDGSTKTDFSTFPHDLARLVHHRRNFGYGAALKTGIKNARYPWIAIIDADATYPPEVFSQLIEAAGDNEMVIGSRPWESISLMRRPAKRTITMLASFLADYRIPDLNSGMRVFRRELYEEYRQYYPDKFSFSSTLTMVALTQHRDVSFVGIPYHKRVGKSSIHPIKDTIRFVTQLFRLTLYFRPMRFFLPLSIGLLALAVGRGVRDYVLVGQIGGMALILFFMGFQVFFFGILAEIINKKLYSL